MCFPYISIKVFVTFMLLAQRTLAVQTFHYRFKMFLTVETLITARRFYS